MIVVEQTFLLPFPPSVNALYRNVPRIGRVKTAAYKAWKLEAGLKLNLQHPKPMPGPVRIEIIAVPPDKRKRDLMNLEKAVSDLLVEHGIIEDDSLVQSAALCWGSDNLSGISVTVLKHTLPAPSGALQSKKETF